jgi:hypothetical protein
MRPKPTDYLAETLNKSHASDLTAPSPFLLRSNPFPLKFSSSRDLGIGNHSTWAQTVKEHAKLAPKVDPVKLGRESPIRNWDGEEPAFAHKSTVRFSATGVPSFEVHLSPCEGTPFFSSHLSLIFHCVGPKVVVDSAVVAGPRLHRRAAAPERPPQPHLLLLAPVAVPERVAVVPRRVGGVDFPAATDHCPGTHEQWVRQRRLWGASRRGAHVAGAVVVATV